MQKKRLILAAILFAACIILTLYLAPAVHLVISRQWEGFHQLTLANGIKLIAADKQAFALFAALMGMALILVLMIVFSRKGRVYESEMVTVTDKIRMPAPAGRYELGSAQWLPKADFGKVFATFDLDIEALKMGSRVSPCGGFGRRSHPSFPPEAGIVLGMSKRRNRETIYFNGGDTHTLCLGATRSGKSRTVVLQSIGLMGLAGESMVISDAKGELQAYTTPYLKQLGYTVSVIDFRDPLKSRRFNFLQRIIGLVKKKNIPRAIEAAWDMTSMLVGECKSGERIWHDGESAVIASAILAVVIENMERPQFQNMTNVYAYISEMCRIVGNDLPVNRYMKTLPQDHPARQLMGIAEVAPSRTRGSFFTGALTTLRLFTSPLIYDMTCRSDFDPVKLGSEKQAVFLVLPDDRTTYYPLAALFVAQLYETLVDEAVKRGDKLERKINFVLDEFGNFVPIPGMTAKISAAASRGMRFNLFLQSLSQLDEKYGREVAQTLLGNCETTLFLSANDTNTQEAISKRLGMYTVATTSQSSSYNTANMSSGNSSMSSNLHSRALLTPEEVGKIARPYTLVLHGGKNPAMLHSPDLSEWHFNKLFGMGDIEHNRRLRQERDAKRPARRAGNVKPEYWGIWNQFNAHYANKSNQIIKERLDDE